MKKTNRKKIEEFIRVDHAGERGAVKIYEGQLLALNTFIKDDTLKVVLIGPEGDFSPAERKMILENKNTISFSLSKNILKTETATIVALSLVSYSNDL